MNDLHILIGAEKQFQLPIGYDSGCGYGYINGQGFGCYGGENALASPVPWTVGFGTGGHVLGGGWGCGNLRGVGYGHVLALGNEKGGGRSSGAWKI
jgi:hypothetical protein